MQFASAIAIHTNPAFLATDLAAELSAGLKNAQPDIIFLFVTMPMQGAVSEIVQILRERLHPKALIGCTAESVAGGQQEIEGQPAASAIAMKLPGVTIDTFHFADEEFLELLGEEGTLKNRLEAGSDLRAFIMMADPFTTPIVQLLSACSALFPEAPIIGGMTSGISQPGESRLMLDDQVHASGLVGISIAGPINVDCVVSQGCRAVGSTYEITKGHRNVIEQLDGKAALTVVEELLSGLTIVERELIQSKGLQIGRAIDEGKGNFGHGDFLIRPLIRLDKQAGAIEIGDMIGVGQTIQFHVHDAVAANEDLRLLLEGEILLASPPEGILMFSCSGRGTPFFGNANHDIATAREILGPAPTAGMFCAGEFGPVGNRNFIHGNTLSLALFRSA